MSKNQRADLLSLFVDGQPVVFEVQRDQECFHFEPLSSWKDIVTAERFSLEKNKTDWVATTTIDKDLYYQAVEEIEIRYSPY